MNVEVYAYGNGDLLVSTFNAIVMLMGANMFATAMLVTGLAAALFVLVQGVFSANRRFDWHWFLIFIFVVNVMFVPKANVLVVDQNMQFVNPGPPPLVSNVPIGLAYLAHGASTAGYVMTNLFETAFGDPAGMAYSQNGLGFSQNMLSTSTQQFILPSQFKGDLDNYIQACVLTDILAGTTSAATISGTSDLFTAISSASARITYYGSPPAPIPCAVAYTLLSAARATAETNGWMGYLNQLFAVQTTSANAINASIQSELGATLLNTYNGIGATGYATAQDIIFQSMMIHQMHESVSNFAAANQGQAALLNLGIAQSDQQAKNGWIIGGELAKKYLPMLRGIMEGFIYGLFPIALLLMLTPGGGKMVIMYLMALIWVQSWSPLYAILNHYIIIYAAKAIPGAAGLTMNNFAVVNSGAQDMLAVLGGMGTMIPMVALALVKGGSLGVESLMGAASSGMSGAASTGGALATTGNLSYGNSHIGNSSYHNASAWQTNLSSSFTEGRSITDNDGVKNYNTGSNFTEGSVPGMSLNYKNSLQSSISQEKGVAASERESHTAEAAHKLAGVFQARDSSDRHASTGDSTSTGTSENTKASEGSSFKQALSEAKKLSVALTGSEDKGYQMLANYTANAHGGLSVPLGKVLGADVGASGGTGSEVSDKSSSQYQESYQRFQDAMSNIGVDKVYNETKDWAKSAQEGHAEGITAKSGQSISASMDKIDSETEQASNAHSRELKLAEMEKEVNSSSREFSEKADWAVIQAAKERGMDNQTLNKAIMNNDTGIKAQLYERAEQLMAGNYIAKHLDGNSGDSEKFGNLQSSVKGGSFSRPGIPLNPAGSSAIQNNIDGTATVKADATKNGSDLNAVGKNVSENQGQVRQEVSHQISQKEAQIAYAYENTQGAFQKTEGQVNQGIDKAAGKTTDLNDSPVIKILEGFRRGDQAISAGVIRALNAGTPEQRETFLNARSNEVMAARREMGLLPPNHPGETREDLHKEYLKAKAETDVAEKAMLEPVKK